MADMDLKDDSNVVHTVNMDTVAGVDTQVVKFQLGAAGVDDGLVAGNNPMPTKDINLEDIYNLLTIIAERLEFGNIKSAGHKLKVDLVDSGALNLINTLTTLTTCATVSALTNQVRIGDMQAQRVVEAQMDAAFAAGFTNHITF